jgi:acyl-CoA thioesterase FadM
VNNVIYNRWAESARVEWVSNYAIHHDPENGIKWSELMSSRSDGLILRSIRTDYKFPMTWPDHISVFHKLRELPREGDSNFVLDVMILSERHRRPAARCDEDIVVYDYKAGKKRSIMPFMMKAFKETWNLQEEMRQRVEKRIVELEGTVRRLESETWDKAEGVEDVSAGSAKG